MAWLSMKNAANVNLDKIYLRASIPYTSPYSLSHILLGHFNTISAYYKNDDNHHSQDIRYDMPLTGVDVLGLDDVTNWPASDPTCAWWIENHPCKNTGWCLFMSSTYIL